MSDMTSLSSLPPHSLSPNMTRSSGFISFNNRDPKNSEELEEEYHRLREENHQLQLRILGVNELARLLQDRNESVQIYQEKNKRLEVAVVRLENRCANIEKMSKKGGGASLQTKSGQSPFIPGPSRQILEGLMRENSELKKTVNNLTKKGASGYLEAVKLTQLEELIECQKDELQFQREQIKALTDSGDADSKEKPSGGLSLPGHVSDSGPLKRQLIKSQHAMKVKDRFCALLSQQIAELQNQLTLAQRQIDENPERSKSHESVSGGGNPIEESTPPDENPHLKKSEEKTSELEAKYKKLMDEQKNDIQKMRDEHATTLEKLEKIENDLRKKSRQTEELEKERDRLTTYHQTLLAEKEELTQTLQLAQGDLEDLMSRKPGGDQTDQPGGNVSNEDLRKLQLERENRDLQKVLNDEVTQHGEQRRSYEADLMVLRAQVEEADMKTGIAESKLQHQLNEHGQEVSELKRKIKEYESKVCDLDDDISGLKSENSELKMRFNETKAELGHAKTARTMPPPPTAGYRSDIHARDTIARGVHNLVYQENKAGMAMVRDGLAGDNRSSPSHCGDKPVHQIDYRQSLMARGGVQKTENKPNLDLPLSQASHVYNQGYYKQGRSTSPQNMPGRMPPAPNQSFPSQVPRGGNQMLAPSATYPQQHHHMRGAGMQQGFQRTHSGNQPSQMPPTPGSPYRPHTQPISLATSPTFPNTQTGRPANYSGILPQPGGGVSTQQAHPLTTSSSMYSQGPAMYSNTGRLNQPSVYPPGPMGVRPGLIYQHPDDETSIPGGQRSTSPHSPYYGGGQHR